MPYEEEVAGQRMQVVEDQLSKAHYILGKDFTAVDIVCGQVLTLAEVSCNNSPLCNACMQTMSACHQRVYNGDIYISIVLEEMLTACRSHFWQIQSILTSEMHCGVSKLLNFTLGLDY